MITPFLELPTRLALGAAALVTWAFWPTADRGGKPLPPVHHLPRHSRARRGLTPIVGLVILAAVTSGSVLGTPAQAARADPFEEVIEGTHLVLTSIADAKAMTSMAPGKPVSWQVGVQTRDADSGEVTFGISSAVPTLSSFQQTVQSCTVRWQEDRCETQSETLIDAQPVIANDGVVLGSMPVDEERWLLVTAWFDDRPAPARGSPVILGVFAEGMGDEVSTQTPLLAATGSGSLMVVVFIAVCFIVGLLVVFLSVQHSRRHVRWGARN